MKTPRLSIPLPPDVDAEIRRRALERGVSRAAVAAELLTKAARDTAPPKARRWVEVPTAPGVL